jgi:hypothetical protein
VRAVCSLAVRAADTRRAPHTFSFFLAHRRPDLSLSCSRAQQDKEHHKGEEDVRTLPVKMGSSPPKSNMSK